MITMGTKKATKAQLREEIRQLRLVAFQMANIGYNLEHSTKSQLTVERAAHSLKELQIQYDKIKRSE